jgi:hypothetical protein
MKLALRQTIDQTPTGHTFEFASLRFYTISGLLHFRAYREQDGIVTLNG